VAQGSSRTHRWLPRTPMFGVQQTQRVPQATKLVMAGCLLLGAAFGVFSKMDKTGFLGANALRPAARAPAPVMQNAATAPAAEYLTRAPGVTSPSIEIQGESLRTWSYKNPAVEKVQVVLTTIGRPLEAGVEVWNGAGNTPIQVRAYSEDGELRPFSAVLETPRGPSTVAIRNIGQMEFPLTANVDHQNVARPSGDHWNLAQNIQGGSLRTFPLGPLVENVEVLLEILQGPNTNKQVVELYTEDGLDRPFFCIIATPESGNVVKIINTGPVEFPLTASVVPQERYL